MSVMEEEHQQSISNNNQGGDEELNSSLTICKNVESSEDDKVVAEDTMSRVPLNGICHTVGKQKKMKLIVRSQYWGRELKGRTCRNVYTNMNVKAPLVITSQAVLYNTDGFWGCCPHHGKRVLELQEYHFSDACEGCHWDLYLVGTWISPSQSTHDFFLLPQNQTSVDIERNERLNGWSYYGTCNTSMIRSGIDDMLRDLLLQNDAYGHRYRHVHIDIMMDKAFDIETPRSRKLNNEKARVDRKKNTDSTSHNCERHESSVTTEATASTEQESPPSADSKASNGNKSVATKIVGAAPPIPRLIPNDSVYQASISHSMANPVFGYQDARWTGETTHWNQDQFSVPSRSGLITGRSGQVAIGSEHQGMYWHPAKAIPLHGGMPQQQSYWHSAQSAPFATAAPQPYYHVSDMQMHQYPVGIQNTHPHYMTSGIQHRNMVFSENQQYTGMNTDPGNSFYTDPSMVYREPTEGSNINFHPYSFANVSTSDDSAFPPPPPPELGYSPPGMSSGSPVSALLVTAEVSPVEATKTPSIVPSDDLGVPPRSSSTLLDNTVEGSPVNVTTSAAAAATGELCGIPTDSQLLADSNSE
jgi:hypothetical protein